MFSSNRGQGAKLPLLCLIRLARGIEQIITRIFKGTQIDQPLQYEFMAQQYDRPDSRQTQQIYEQHNLT